MSFWGLNPHAAQRFKLQGPVLTGFCVPSPANDLNPSIDLDGFSQYHRQIDTNHKGFGYQGNVDGAAEWAGPLSNNGILFVLGGFEQVRIKEVLQANMDHFTKPVYGMD